MYQSGCSTFWVSIQFQVLSEHCSPRYGSTSSEMKVISESRYYTYINGSSFIIWSVMLFQCGRYWKINSPQIQYAIMSHLWSTRSSRGDDNAEVSISIQIPKPNWAIMATRRTAGIIFFLVAFHSRCVKKPLFRHVRSHFWWQMATYLNEEDGKTSRYND